MSLSMHDVVSGADLLATPVVRFFELNAYLASLLAVAEIDPALADTAAFCERYDWRPEDSANCVVIAGKRGEAVRYAACVVLATTKADVNGTVRRLIDARKASFAQMDDAVVHSGMEFGGITPFGLPEEWPVFVDSRVIERAQAVFGSGVRRSKLFGPGRIFLDHPGAEVIEDLAKE